MLADYRKSQHIYWGPIWKDGLYKKQTIRIFTERYFKSRIIIKNRRNDSYLVNALNTLSEEVIKLIAERTPSLKTLSVLLERTKKKKKR